jgi:[histone H3]-lysine36 N-dimethyltransferase SETMAR
MEREEVRAVIKYLCMKKMSTLEIHEDLKRTLGESAPAYSTVAKWAAEFRRGRSSCDDDPRTGRPSSSVVEDTIAKVEKLVLADRRLTIRYIAKTVGISFGSTQTILTEHLKLRKVSARWVPRMLTTDQQHDRLKTCRQLLERFSANREDFIFRYVTVDETWVHHFDPETKQQSMAWKHKESPPPKKFRVVPSAGKIMATVFWDASGILLVDYLERGCTITGEYYAQLIPKLRNEIKKKRRGKLTRGVLFHHDNAPVHTSEVAVAAINAAGFELMPHPSYSPDLAPSDFYLFRHLKKNIKGRRFSDDNDVMNAVDDWFDEQSEDFFSQGIRELEHRWHKCISVEGNYVEK